MVALAECGTHAFVAAEVDAYRVGEKTLAAARAGTDLSDINAVGDAFDQRGLPVIHLARVVEYDVPDRAGNGTGELIVLLSTILDLHGDNGARADELAVAYQQRWERTHRSP